MRTYLIAIEFPNNQSQDECCEFLETLKELVDGYTPFNFNLIMNTSEVESLKVKCLKDETLASE